MKKRVLLQIPEGLITKALEIAEELQNKGYEVIISAEPCYGACDLREREARALGCEKIIHYAHSKFIESKIPVEYIELREKFEISEEIREELKKIKESVVCIVASLQFVDALNALKQELEKLGKKVFLGEGKKNGKILYPGQILGCDYSQALCFDELTECYLVLSSGRFHAKGLAMKTEKPVYLLNVEKRCVEKIYAYDFIKQKILAQEKAREANVIAIAISVKPGQMKLELAEKVKQLAENIGKKTFLVMVDELKPEKFMYLGVECIINTACPRVAIEERGNYKIPILNADEFFEMVKRNENDNA